MRAVQRVRGAESRIEMRAVKWTAEGMVKDAFRVEYSMTWRIRQLRGVCRYPAERTGFPVKQGGTADNNYSSLAKFFAGDFLL